ncbi:MAG: hypothetical protein LJF04_12315 [Gemmatimonadetes bacterium]|nr:hypothetical protein [Gemmatimonadota bacterium]
MHTTIALVADLWGHVGPGLVFAFALPVFLLAFGAIALTAAKQVRGRSRA